MPPKAPSSLKTYYDTLAQVERLGRPNEGAVRIAFHNLLADWGRLYGITILGEQTITGLRKRSIQLDGLLVDEYKLHRGIWEAKDTADKLEAAIRIKIDAGYPLTNTLFENTREAVLYQDGRRVGEYDLTQPATLQRVLTEFLTYRPAQIEEFHQAVARFRTEIPQLAASLSALIDDAKRTNRAFRSALEAFLALCRASLNPATSQMEVEDMLKQHILTERIFRSIFENADFVRRNAVAVELERMVDALTSQAFSRAEFLRQLDYFYRPIEETARTISDYQEKQDLLRTLYEQFFQAYSTRAADTHGIVYTPAEIVRWMVCSVEQALAREFELSLAAPGVHIIDPCVGTGTFLMELLRQIPAAALEAKYRDELHANEVLLLPYYIAAQNIEHAYYERMGRYVPFEGICFADTLDLAEGRQMELFAPTNIQRIAKQKQAPIFVVLGNPPYNVGQENENDNNKNRKYPRVDSSIRGTYGKASQARLQTKLYDMYVRFFRWATDRLGDRNGIVCFVSNNSFLDQIAFDGMRQHLQHDFTRIYIFDLGGNVRKNPKLSGTRHNVFGIQPGVAITLLIRSAQHTTHEVYYARLDEFWIRAQKLERLAAVQDYTHVEWQELTPDARNSWLTEGLSTNFDTFLPMGTKGAKESRLTDTGVESIFKTYSLGVSTNRDMWVYDFDREELARRVRNFIEAYNDQVARWMRRDNPQADVDDFVVYDERRLKWSRNLKRDLKRGQFTAFSSQAIRTSLYRPFTEMFLYFADQLIDERGTTGRFFPTVETEQENSAVCVSGIGQRAPFTVLVAHVLPNLALNAIDGFQCFPFYTYAEDGRERRENITDWAWAQFQAHYDDATLSKWDIFHYVYAVLHAPAYRTRYAENLKRDLPRIPFVGAGALRAYVAAGARLAALHRDYMMVTPYPLARVETPGVPFTWTVDERGMRLAADRTALCVNPSLTLTGIPATVFAYRLGNRSALEWVIDQYRVHTDSRSGLRHDPNDPDHPAAIVELVGRVVRVSLDTLATIAALPPLE